MSAETSTTPPVIDVKRIALGFFARTIDIHPELPAAETSFDTTTGTFTVTKAEEFRQGGGELFVHKTTLEISPTTFQARVALSLVHKDETEVFDPHQDDANAMRTIDDFLRIKEITAVSAHQRRNSISDDTATELHSFPLPETHDQKAA